MASLDKSLDDIISSKRPARKFQAKKKAVKNTKALVSKKPVAQKAALVKQAKILDASYATKVVVYGLPKDITLDAIKSQVGGVGNIALSYNEKGQFKGIATIIFKSSNSATKAVEKYNGAPIDNGKSKLKLELIVDPTKRPLAQRISAPAKPLAQRIQPQLKQAARQVAKAKQAKKAPAAPKKAAKKAPKPKKEKKTVEQLDQEMADYFDN